MNELLYRLMTTTKERLCLPKEFRKSLSEKGLTVSQYRASLYKRSGELYRMLHDMPRGIPASMTREEILQEMEQVSKSKDELFSYTKM